MLDEAAVNPEELLALARDGDQQAAGRLFETYRSYLTLLARLQIDRRLNGKADAADLVQETFLQALCDLPSFKGTTEAQWLAWLRRILRSKVARLAARYCGTQARNVALERQIDRELDDSSHALGQLVDPGTSPSQRAMRRERAVLLADALERLPEDYRQVILLHQLEGRTLDEVAKCLGRSIDSVTKLWIRGLEKLQRLLEERCDDSDP